MKNGFSLVELSIVLVILGLLTGGILAGQSLIRAAELRAVGTEYQRYLTATQTFRDKYFAIPGDMSNATKFWGIAAGTGSDATCFLFASTDAKTCDGNGNGMIDLPDGSNYSEHNRFWQHLANAGLIEGSYPGNYAWPAAIGVNTPKSKLNNAGWSVYSVPGYFPGDALSVAGTLGNYFTLGAYTAGWFPINAVLKPEEAWNIDTKLDDGKPMSGKVVPYRWATCTNGASGGDQTATYLLSSSSIVCPLQFLRAF